jgi:hypothetical protein
MQTEYWAHAPIEKIADEVVAKFKNYKTWLRTSGYGDKIRKAYQAYYVIKNEGAFEIRRDKSEIDRISVNHYKSLIKRIHIMVTENKLAFQPRAKNSDSKSQIEADLAKGICEFYGDEKKMNEILSRAVLGSLIMFEQFIHTPWDQAEGYELSVDGEKIIKSGDQTFQLYSPLDVARNTSVDKSSWYIVREKVNKYDLATLYPEFADEIKSTSLDRDEFELGFFENEFRRTNLNMIDDHDMVYKYHLYHARTPSVESGRYTIICANQVLSDGPLIYDKVPVYRLQAGTVLETPFSESVAIDLLPLQQGLDAVFSAVTTNSLNNAKQLIYCPDPNLDYFDLQDGQTAVIATQPPIGLNLSATSPETHKLIDMFVSHSQLLSGINESARGNPGGNLKSGTSLAVMLAQAIQYVNDVQKNYAQVASDVATALVSNIQKFASEEMVAYISGTSRKGSIKKFKAEDIMDVERITVDLGSPLVQTLAGRNEIAQQFLQYGLVKDPKQLVSFLRTGELDQTTESLFSDAMLIREENEQIKKGVKPTVLILDNHMEHILEHKTIFSSPEARLDETITKAGLAHIQEHIDWMRKTPPDLAAVVTGQPLPAPQAPDQSQSPQPTVQGARMPSMPPGTPDQVAANYEQALQGMPQQQGAPQ